MNKEITGAAANCEAGGAATCYDLIVIGAGPGGYEAAYEAAKEYGMKVALVEADKLGGTCLNRGCIPTKTLLHSTGLYHELKKNGEAIGIMGADALRVDLAAVQQHKDRVLEQLRNGIAALMKAGKVDVFFGKGSLLSRESVRVIGEDGEEALLSGKRILLATGSVPAVPPIPGADLAGVVTSDRLLDVSEPLESLVIIGGGVIGCEFASVFSALGTKVTIVEAMDRLLPTLDKELGQSLKLQFKKAGIETYVKAAVKEICAASEVSKGRNDGESGEGGKGGLLCRLEDKEIPCQKVLIATGRRPYFEGLIAEAATAEIKEIKTERGRVLVGEDFETSVSGVYAIGDLIGGIQLAHVATAEGRCALAAMMGEEPPVDLKVIPSCIYTEPEIACVGMNEEEAAAAGLCAVSQKYSMGANGKSVLELCERGFIKVVSEAGTGRVLGAFMLCSRATDMVSQFAAAITEGLTLEQMRRVVYPHPTFSEALGEAVKIKK